MSTAKRTGTKGVPRAAREQQILDAAGQELAARGFAGLTVDAVAARVGVSKPLVYGYFESREGLAAACVERAGRSVTEQVERALASGRGPVLDRAAQMLSAIFEALGSRPYDWPVLFDPSIARDSRAHQVAMTYRRRMAEQATIGVAAAAGHLDAPDLDALTAMWMHAVSGLVDWWIRHPDQTAAQMAERSVRLTAAIRGI